MDMQTMSRATWAEIDLNAVRANFRAIRRRCGGAGLCCVVKANAYGHGAVQIARVCEEMGAKFLAVSSLAEAMQLRHARIQMPILILGYTDPACAPILSLQKISQCVFSVDYAQKLYTCAKEHGVRVNVHVKIDTGMGRIGFIYRDAADHELDGMLALCDGDVLVPEGIFTHLSSASDGKEGEDFTQRQIALFEGAVRYFRDRGVSFAFRHAANSAAVTAYPDACFDMVRVGILLYGHASAPIVGAFPLRPILRLKTTVVHIKRVKKGDTVGYSRTFVADRDMTVATVPIGYADGLLRSNGYRSGCMEVLEKPAPIIGGVCMDQCMLDVSGIEGVTVGNEVVVYGNGRETSIEVIAQRNATVPYEILCGIGERVPRVYLENRRVVEIVDRVSP